mgnify:CR=1 FL=1
MITRVYVVIGIKSWRWNAQRKRKNRLKRREKVTDLAGEHRGYILERRERGSKDIGRSRKSNKIRL